MSRIAIIGNAGGGKSVLAQDLGRLLRLPVHSIDDVQWRPGWTRAPESTVVSAHSAWLRGPAWIIDGWGSWELITTRFAAADTIIFIDFPLHVHYRWALRRQLEVMLGRRRGWPPAGCSPWPITRELLRVMRYVDRELRPRLLALVREERLANRVVHLRSPGELRRWGARIRARAV